MQNSLERLNSGEGKGSQVPRRDLQGTSRTCNSTSKDKVFHKIEEQQTEMPQKMMSFKYKASISKFHSTGPGGMLQNIIKLSILSCYQILMSN